MNMNEKCLLRVDDWVEVRSKEEILKTLDRNGQLDGMPFMPEMFAFCGQRLRVHKRAHKTCDTVFPTRSRRISHAVHLETRCSGSAHGGCQAGCLIFWKEAWLKRVEDASEQAAVTVGDESFAKDDKGCIEEDVIRATCLSSVGIEVDPVFVCQATRLPYFSKDLSPYEFLQYLEDYSSGNVGLGQWIRGIIYISYQNLIKMGIGLGRPLRWFYERFQRLRGGLPYPRWSGKIPVGQPTPTGRLDLKEGERVRVKSYQDILATLTEDNKNRGMLFDGEMMPYCGREFRVQQRVTQIINEQTGRMMTMKNPCIILENVVCQARYSECRMFCPRKIYLYWREIWLERVVDDESVPEQKNVNSEPGAPRGN